MRVGYHAPVSVLRSSKEGKQTAHYSAVTNMQDSGTSIQAENWIDYFLIERYITMETRSGRNDPSVDVNLFAEG
jgi:hypothetical protein